MAFYLRSTKDSSFSEEKEAKRLIGLHLTVSLCLFFVASALHAAERLSGGEQRAVDAAAEDTLAALSVPGATLAIVKGGEIVYAQAYGFARLPNTRATPNMAFPVGSVSKQFTASLILSLAQDGKLSLDDKVGKFLPKLTGADQVTIRQILSHTAGYPDYAPEDYSTPPMQKATTPAALAADWGSRKLDFTPGTDWQYSNTGYTIAGLIAEKAGGAPLFAQIQARITGRLHLASAADYDADNVAPGGPLGYQRYALGPPRQAPLDRPGWSFGSGQMEMTASDLARWDISLIKKSLLSNASYAALETPVRLTNGTDTQYGLGVEVRDVDGHHAVYHSGEETGYTAYNETFPTDRLAVAVMVNEDATPAATVIARQIEAAVFGIQGVTGKDKASRRTAKLLGQLATGQIEASGLTDNTRAYFSPAVLADYRNSLAPLGPVIGIVELSRESRGGMVFHAYRVRFLRRRVGVTTYELPDGKLDQLLVEP
jgi:CubicO group peptidase (beta-lactamase class C family)